MDAGREGGNLKITIDVNLITGSTFQVVSDKENKVSYELHGGWVEIVETNRVTIFPLHRVDRVKLTQEPEGNP